MFTEAEKVDIRRFCGYPAYGAAATQGFEHRFYTRYGTLEYRLNNLDPAEETVIRNTYLANLATLETAIVGTSANLDTDEAAVWKHNKREQADRENLFDSWRRRLCGFLGIPPGPELSPGGGLRLVV